MSANFNRFQYTQNLQSSPTTKIQSSHTFPSTNVFPEHKESPNRISFHSSDFDSQKSFDHNFQQNQNSQNCSFFSQINNQGDVFTKQGVSLNSTLQSTPHQSFQNKNFTQFQQNDHLLSKKSPKRELSPNKITYTSDDEDSQKNYNHHFHKAQNNQHRTGWQPFPTQDPKIQIKKLETFNLFGNSTTTKTSQNQIIVQNQYQSTPFPEQIFGQKQTQSYQTPPKKHDKPKFSEPIISQPIIQTPQKVSYQPDYSNQSIKHQSPKKQQNYQPLSSPTGCNNSFQITEPDSHFFSSVRPSLDNSWASIQFQPRSVNQSFFSESQELRDLLKNIDNSKT